jgi:hypothetical protein
VKYVFKQRWLERLFLKFLKYKFIRTCEFWYMELNDILTRGGNKYFITFIDGLFKV